MNSAAAFAAIIRDGKVLLVRSLTSRQFTNHWSLPGGMVENGESAEQGAIRESIEETGIVCDVDDLITEFDNVEEGVRINIFKARYISGEILLEDGEIADARWLTIEDSLKLPLAYNTKAILLTLRQTNSQKRT